MLIGSLMWCSDLEVHHASDFNSEPADFLPSVTNQTIREWGSSVNQLWNYLSRKVG